jgi:hypothetical protein
MRAPSLRFVALVASAPLAAACGEGTPPPPTQLQLRPAYDVTSVLRVLADGETPTRLAPFTYALEDLVSSGARFSGRLVGPLGAREVLGNFDAATGVFTIEPFTGTFTSTVEENVEQLGGTALDGTPEDGRADELTTFLRARRPSDAEVRAGGGVAAARRTGRPDAPDATRLSAQARSLGVATLTAPAGTFTARVGVEVLTFDLAGRTPELVAVSAGADGSLTAEVEAVPGDALTVRAVQVGIAGPAVVVRVRE